MKASAKLPGREKVYIPLIIILVLVVAFQVFQNELVLGPQQKAVDKLKDVYELITESEVEVLKVEEQSGIYKVLLRLRGIRGDSLEEVYVTKDGNLITDKIIDTEDYKARLEKQKSFLECMAGKNLRVFGQSNELNTVQQLQILGNFAYKVYIDCTGANLQVCQQLGIQQVPTIFYNNMNYTGVKPIEWFEQLTGCKL